MLIEDAKNKISIDIGLFTVVSCAVLDEVSQSFKVEIAKLISKWPPEVVWATG